MEKAAGSCKDLFPVSQEILGKLKEYYDIASKKYVYFFASILDPRLKLQWLKGHPEFKKIKSQFIAEAEKYDRHSLFEGTFCSDASESDGEWESTIFKKRKISNFSAEVKLYFQQDVIEASEDPLIYWKQKKDVFPSLALMARSFLAIPATSTPSERAFSRGRIVLSHLRNRLTAEKTRALLCLQSWYKNKMC